MKSLNKNIICVSEALKYGRKSLKDAGIEGYMTDSLVLLAHSIGTGKEAIFSHGERILTGDEKSAYISAIERRMEETPVQYITSHAEFMGLSFYVDESVLIPRADTEIVAELLIDICKGIKNPKILDICTGSGCIAISGAKYIEDAQIIATDISKAALDTATKNAKKLGASDKIEFCAGNIFSALLKINRDFTEFFDIIVSNPPYISHYEMDQLIKQVKDYEPHAALNGGADGLDFYRRIAGEAFEYIKPNGYLLFEIGYNQAEAVSNIMKLNGFENISLYKDLAGLDRALGGRKCSTG